MGYNSRNALKLDVVAHTIIPALEKSKRSPAVVAHTLHLSNWEVETGGSLSFRTPWSTQRNPVSKEAKG